MSEIKWRGNLKKSWRRRSTKKKRNNNRKYGGEEDKQNEVKERDRSIKLESRMGLRRGVEMAKSLAILFNRIEEEEGEVPKQWQLTTIKSVRKKRNQKKLSKIQRGLFMVNVVSNVHEVVKKIQNKKKSQKYEPNATRR